MSIPTEHSVTQDIKLTKNRRLLMQILEQADTPLTALEICQLAFEADRKLSQGSVYRSLRIFENKGLVTRITFGQECARYQLIGTGPSDCVVLVSTGDILPLNAGYLNRLRQEIAVRLGRKPRDIRLEIRAHE